MNYYYVTGTSRGIGLALAERLLREPDTQVTGMARGDGIAHARYRHVRLDLSDLEQVQGFTFEPHADARRIVLINNAGFYVGETVGNHPASSLIQAFHVNLVAPALLANRFVDAYRTVVSEKLILNIASQAGRRPVYGISTMCASKAGIDMLSRVIAEEQKHAQPDTAFRVLSVAPPLVDTTMYAMRRRAIRDDPVRRSLQRNLDQERPADPRSFAEELWRLISQPGAAPDVLVSGE